VEAGAAAFVRAVQVMQLSRSVEADAYRETFAGEKGTPGVVEQGAVGLQGIANVLAAGELALVVHGALEELQAEQGGFAALPGELHFRAALRGDIALHVGTQ